MTGRLLVLASAGIAALWAAPAWADEPPFGTVLRQEFIGGEIAPLSLNQGSPPHDPPPRRVQPGIGLKLRLFRHRWSEGAYWTPVQAGGFLGYGGGDRTILLDVQTEGGAITHVGGLAIEGGLGLGAGVLGVSYATVNASKQQIGGVGLIASSVLRVLFRERRTHTFGLVARAEIPLSLPPSNFSWGGYWTARGTLFLLAFDVGFGRS